MTWSYLVCDKALQYPMQYKKPLQELPPSIIIKVEKMRLYDVHVVEDTI